MENHAANSNETLLGALGGGQIHPCLAPKETPREKAFARLRLLWESRQFLLRAMVAGLVLFAVLAFLIPSQYQSTTRLMPPEQPDAGMAMLTAASGATAETGLGAVAGDLLNLKSSGALFIGILQSRTVRDALVDQFSLRSAYGVSRSVDARAVLAQNTAILEDRKGGIITIEVTDRSPQRAAAIAQGYVDELNQVVTQLNTTSAHRERVFLEQRLEQVKQDLESAEREFGDFASQNAAIDIQAQGKAVIDAAAILEGQAIAAQSELQSLKQVYSDGNVRVRETQARVDELNRQLQKMGGSADLSRPGGEQADSSMVPTIRKLPILGVGYADRYCRTKIEEALFQALTQEYEFAKVEEAKETPSVKVIDPPDIPEEKSSPHRLWIILLGAFFSVVSGITWIFGRARWETIDSRDPGKVLALEVLGTMRARLRRIVPQGARAAVGNTWSLLRRRPQTTPQNREHSHLGAADD